MKTPKIRLYILIQRLRQTHLVVLPSQPQKLLMRALLQDLPVRKDKDARRIPDCAQPVRHSDRSATSRRVIEGALHETFTFRVQGAGGFV